jgi:hypothetical protein
VPVTWVGFYVSNYSILQATARIVVLHSYILEQLVFGAPREWVHLCLAHRIDCLSFHVEGLCHPPPLSALVCLLGLACPGFCYQLAPSSYSHKSHIQFPYDYQMRSKSSYICLTLWAHDTFHKYIYELWLLFLFFLLLAR